MKRQKPSIIRMIQGSMQIQIMMLILLLLGACYITGRISVKQVDSALNNYLSIYEMQIDDHIHRIEELLREIVYDNTDLTLLDGDDSLERFYASNRLKTTIQNAMLVNDSADILMVLESKYDICLDYYNIQISHQEKQAIRSFVKEEMAVENSNRNWHFVSVDGRVYLIRRLEWDQRGVVALVSADHLMRMILQNEDQNSFYVLADEKEIIWGYAGEGMKTSDTENGQTALQEEKLIGSTLEELAPKRMLKKQAVLDYGNLQIIGFESYRAIWKGMEAGGVLIVGAIALLVLFDILFVSIIKRQMILPMERMTAVMSRIGEGDYDLRIEDGQENQEFSMLTGTFNRLMDELLHLKLRFFEKQLALSDAEQKYIRMQIRPHFFLNAMTTISSLSMKGKMDEINRYIDALSKNIRYMFSSGLHTVSLKEEIRHVENYFEMQELKYPDSVFYYVDMPEELGEWRVPQMIIHTIIENEYKYAVVPDEVLTILLKVETQVIDGEEMLVIEIEDDGKGYPTDVIDTMNQDNARMESDGSRVGLWSIKRLLELMYDRKELFSIYNVSPHGAGNRIRIPKVTVNERSKEELSESGIR